MTTSRRDNLVRQCLNVRSAVRELSPADLRAAADCLPLAAREMSLLLQTADYIERTAGVDGLIGARVVDAPVGAGAR